MISSDTRGYAIQPVGICTDLLYNSFSIDDEHASQTDTFILDQHPVVAAYSMCGITEQRDINHPQAAILPRNVLPMPQRVFCIDRNEHNTTAAILELAQTVLEGQNFSGAHETEGSWNEEYDEPWCVRVGCTWFDIGVNVGAKSYLCCQV
jgi:hypothetical protein